MSLRLPRPSLAALSVIGAFAIMASVETARADTIVSAGAKPGVATKWSSKNGSVKLEIKEGFSPSEVADAILRGVPGAEVSLKKGAVIVVGVEEAKLISALERIEVDREVDDIDEMLQAMQGGDDDEGSGSSIRATKETKALASTGDLSNLPSLMGTVVKVRHKRFPLVMLTVKVEDAGGSKSVSAGDQIMVLPIIRLDGSRVRRGDKQSKANAKAWYARPGDAVRVQLIGQAKDGDYWVAASFKRDLR